MCSCCLIPTNSFQNYKTELKKRHPEWYEEVSDPVLVGHYTSLQVIVRAADVYYSLPDIERNETSIVDQIQKVSYNSPFGCVQMTEDGDWAGIITVNNYDMETETFRPARIFDLLTEELTNVTSFGLMEVLKFQKIVIEFIYQVMNSLIQLMHDILY